MFEGPEGGMMKGLRLWMAAAVVASSLVMTQAARAEEYQENAGWGALAVLANLGYMPAKTVYAVGGGITGGFAYALTGGNYRTASDVWEKSLGGTYVVTPSMIRGEQPIHFAGTESDGSVSEAPADTPPTDYQSNRVEETLPAS
jgi:hypothetical protein